MKHPFTVVATALAAAGLLSMPMHLTKAHVQSAQEGSSAEHCQPGHQNPDCKLDPINVTPPKPEPEADFDHASLFFQRDMEFLHEQLAMQLLMSQWFSMGQDKPNDSGYQERLAQRDAKAVEAMKKGAAEALKDAATIKRIIDAVPVRQQAAVRGYLKNIMKHDFVRLCDTYAAEIAEDGSKRELMTELYFEKSDVGIYDQIRAALLSDGIKTQLKIGVVILETREGSVFALPGIIYEFSDKNLRNAWDARITLKKGSGENSCGS